MRQSLALKTYRMLTRGPGRGISTPDRPPEQPVLWIALSDAAEVKPALALFQRLLVLRGDGALLLTGAEAEPQRRVWCSALPDETRADCERFLDFWSPALCLWSGNSLNPRLIEAAAQRGCRMALIHAQDAPFRTPLPRFGDAALAVLPRFSQIFAADARALARLQALGLRDSRLSPGGRLQDTRPPLRHDPHLHERLAGHLSGRPVWLAAHTALPELSDVLRAHRRANRLAHRLLLFLSPRPDCPVEAAQSVAAEVGLRTLMWDRSALPDEATQVVIVPDPGLLGLLYRLAPVSFIGSSIVSGNDAADPSPAAQFGSAILHGPNVSPYVAAYAQLAEVGATRMVRDTDTLATALSSLLAPDAAAAMAHAAWEVSTESAALTDALLDLAQDALDAAEVA